MKKATTFIVTLTLLTTLLTGCGSTKAAAADNSSTNTVAANFVTTNTPVNTTSTIDDLSEFRQELSELKTADQKQTELINSLINEVKNLQKALLESKTESNASSNAQNTQNGPIYVTAIYNNECLPITIYNKDSKNKCVSNPTVLPYPGVGQIRDLSLIISGCKVKTITSVDSNFNDLSHLSFKEVNGLTHVYFYMNTDIANSVQSGYYDYYFKIITVTDLEYYISVRY